LFREGGIVFDLECERTTAVFVLKLNDQVPGQSQKDKKGESDADPENRRHAESLIVATPGISAVSAASRRFTGV